MMTIPRHVHPANRVINPLITGQKMYQRLHRRDQEKRAEASVVFFFYFILNWRRQLLRKGSSPQKAASPGT